MIDELTTLVPPPGSAAPLDFEAAEVQLGFTLPDDYKLLVNTYGDGAFGGYLQILQPSHLVDSGRYLGECVTNLRSVYADEEWVFPDGSRAPVILPEEAQARYFGWAADRDREICCWYMSGDNPNEWPVATFGDCGVDHHPGGMLAYLTDLVSGRFPTAAFSAQQLAWVSSHFGPYEP